MWRNLCFIAAIVASVFLLPGASTALAAGTANSTVHLAGQAQISGSRRAQQIDLTADSADGAWHLSATLVPVRTRGGFDGQGGQPQEPREREGGGDDFGQGPSFVPAQVSPSQPLQAQTNGIPLVGDFTLAGPGNVSLSGQATGQLAQDGTGQLQLVDDSGTVHLNGSFAIDGAGNLSLDLAGQLPGQAEVAPAPASQGAVAAANGGQSQTNNPFFWYLARAAGLGAYVALFVDTCLGLMVKTPLGFLARWRTFDLHQFTAFLGLGFLAVHVLALLADTYYSFTVQQILVPLMSPYRPAQVALGVIGLYLMVGITASFYVRKHIGQHAWRMIHYLSFALYLLALAHGLFAGTDSGTVWARVLYIGTAAIVGALTVYRAAEESAKKQPASQRSGVR